MEKKSTKNTAEKSEPNKKNKADKADEAVKEEATTEEVAPGTETKTEESTSGDR